MRIREYVSIEFHKVLPKTIVNVNILWAPDRTTTVIANRMTEVLKNLFEKKKSSPSNPCIRTAACAVNGTYGLIVALIKTTIIEALSISPREENNDIKEINITAKPLSNAPLNGILSACKIPPSTDSLNAHSAVILIIANDLSRDVRFSKVLILNLV